jgi:hypothetical protein
MPSTLSPRVRKLANDDFAECAIGGFRGLRVDRPDAVRGCLRAVCLGLRECAGRTGCREKRDEKSSETDD